MYPTSSYFFNVSYLSCFGSENERLWFGGFRPLNFSSIRVLNTGIWIDYKKYIKIFSRFNQVITGTYNTGKGWSNEKNVVTSSDGSVLSSFISPYLSLKIENKKKDVYDKYVDDIWNQFKRKIKTIEIYLRKDRFPFISSFYCSFFFFPYDSDKNVSQL